jgi:hypothetical protein
MKKFVSIFILITLSLAACLPHATATPIPPTDMPSPTDTLTPSPTLKATVTPAISHEMKELFQNLGAKEGEDENGNPIYFVTNPADQKVTVGLKNETGKWEKADAVKYKLYKTPEEAQVSGEIMDTEYVLRGGPGQAAMLIGEKFPENVITGLNIEIITPNWINPYNEQLDFDSYSKSRIKNNPGREPYRNMGWFVYNNIVKGVETPGYGCVWQWLNHDGTIVYTTTIASTVPTSGLEIRPFAGFNFTRDISDNVPIIDQIGHDEIIKNLLEEWADTNIVPQELQNHALIMSVLFK